ncbi:MAG TPA: hypothetical protein EYG02_14230 [Henriciella marina]|nr:hypothetical protein [Henriciella marina]
MTAERKTFSEPHSDPVEHETASGPRPEPACSERHDGSQSPARQLQDDLQNRFVPEGRSSKLRQIAQVLVTASGLTMVFGFFLFSAVS